MRSPKFCTRFTVPAGQETRCPKAVVPVHEPFDARASSPIVNQPVLSYTICLVLEISAARVSSGEKNTAAIRSRGARTSLPSTSILRSDAPRPKNCPVSRSPFDSKTMSSAPLSRSNNSVEPSFGSSGRKMMPRSVSRGTFRSTSCQRTMSWSSDVSASSAWRRSPFANSSTG